MKIKVICVGKLKEKYLKQGIQEYTKRLGSYTKFEVIEVKEKEGQRILAKIKEQDYCFALAINGENPTSESFAQQIDQLMIQGKSDFCFIIGGSLGLSSAVLTRSNAQLSFGKMTYPHQLMRLILVEQIYRSFRINHGEPYHK